MGLVTPFWTVQMVADAGTEGMNADLEFGIYPAATDRYDSGIDVPHPPPGPTPPPFEAYFSVVDPSFAALNKDFRGATPKELTLKAKSTSNDIELTWDASSIPCELWVLVDTGTETIDMKAQSSVVLSAGEYSITILVSEVCEIQLVLEAGWNLISVPVMPADPSTAVVFAGTEHWTNLLCLTLMFNKIGDISALSNLTSLSTLNLADSQINDILSLSNLTDLYDLHLCDNQISDMSPLVDNTVLAEWDAVHLINNPLSADSVNA